MDFSTYDAFITDADSNEYGLIFHTDQGSHPQTSARQLKPVRQDNGSNPWEVRPDSGDVWSQGDFSHGAGQRNFHRANRDERKYRYSSGFDISDPGKLKHLKTVVVSNDGSAPVTALAVANNMIFASAGQLISRYTGSGTWTSSNAVQAGEVDQDVLDLTAEGDRLFAALGSNGVHVRDAAGVWTHYRPDGATDLDVGSATGVEWLKDRLIVIGGTSSRSIYEVVADSTPDPLLTLPAGWSFEKVFETGEFIYACAIGPSSGQSRVYHFGLNQSADTLEAKGSTPMPLGQLIRCGTGYLGMVFLAGGVRTQDGGYDPVLYQALPDARGNLQIIKLAQGEDSGAIDLSVRAIAPDGESIICGWSLADDPDGRTARVGLLRYHLGRDALSYDIEVEEVERPNPVVPITGLVVFAGDAFFSAGTRVYQTNAPLYASTATLITSTADWNNAGQKVWDLFEAWYEALPSGTQIDLYYRTDESGDWTLVGTDVTAGSQGLTKKVAGVSSRILQLKLVSTATIDQTDAPVIGGYSQRSNPAPTTLEFDLVRFVRILPVDRKDEDAEEVYPPGGTTAFRSTLSNLLYSWVTFTEPGDTWNARLTDIADVEPAAPIYDASGGDASNRGFIVRLTMEATRS
jgi:hypothetical protein